LAIDDVKQAVLPRQNGFWVVDMLMMPGSGELACTVMEFEVTGFPLTHCSDDVMVQVMTSPSDGTKVSTGLGPFCSVCEPFFFQR